MKLDKVEKDSKKKNKKAIIITTSVITILTLSGVASWRLFKEEDKISRFEQNIVSGQDVKKSLGDSKEHKKIDDKNDEDKDSDNDFVLDPPTVKSLQSLLSKTGFGYTVNAYKYKYDETTQDMVDKHSESATDGEKLYLLCTGNVKNYSFKVIKLPDDFLTLYFKILPTVGIVGEEAVLSFLEETTTNERVKDKPEYAEDPGENPQMQAHTFEAADDTVPGKTTYYVEAWYTFKGKTVKSERMRAGIFIGSAAEEMEYKAMESIKDQFLQDYAQWVKEKNAYYKWSAWKKARNKWLKEMTEKGFFETHELGTEYDSYTEFWAQVASLSVGIDDEFNYPDYEISDENIEKLINRLYPQIYDENGEEREEVRNLLEAKLALKDVEEDIRDLYPDEKPKEPDQGGDGSGTTGDTTGGGNSSGGSTGGGSTSGGNPGGGSSSGGNPGGGSSSGGNPPSEPIDTVAPSIQKVSITAPTTGVYAKGQEIEIKVDFDKNIYGTNKKGEINEETAPKLIIKFGETGKGKLAKFTSVNGKSIVYHYIIEEEDNGKLQLTTGNNFLGTVYNKDGYKVELTSIEKLETDKEIEADGIAPQVEKIEVISQEGEYKTGQEIEIKVTFSETIYSAKNKVPLVRKTVPNLNICFGEGEIKNPSVKRIDNLEHYITYLYKITEEDRGELKLDAEKAFDGTKTVCDQVGNEVTLIAGKELEGNKITVNSDLTQITMDKKEITLDLNGTKDVIVIASRNIDKDLIWKSSNASVVTIGDDIVKTDLSPNGNKNQSFFVTEQATLTAVGVGESIISVEAPDGTKQTCKVTVKDTTNGNTKVELNQTKLELDLNGTQTGELVATVAPMELPVEWSSTNEEVVIVDQTGKVTAITTGEAQIIAKATDGTTATCEVKVTKDGISDIEPTSIDLNIRNVKVVFGKTNTISLTTKITPTDSNKSTKITYETNDEEIATVNENGLVTIKAKGIVVVTATSENGKNAFCVIEVIDESEITNREIGDVNADQKVDTTDLLTILRHIATCSSNKISEKHQDWVLQGDKYIAADVNGNGIVDVTDSLKLQRHIAASRSETIRENHPDWIIGAMHAEP